MNTLITQFLAEGRDFIQSIGEKLLQLEDAPGDAALMDELFRSVHTLKGNSGLFEIPEMTRVLHAAEDLMDAVRDGRLAFARELADRLLESMDFVAALIDEIAAASAQGRMPDTSRHAAEAARLGESLRALVGNRQPGHGETQVPAPSDADIAAPNADGWRPERIPETLRRELQRRLADGEPFCWLAYRPEEDCFFKGEDPLHQIVQLDDPCWRSVRAREDWPRLAELDAYRCLLTFELILNGTPQTLEEHFRYVPDQVEILPLSAGMLGIASHDSPESPGGADKPAPSADIDGDALWSFNVVLEAQREILGLADNPPWLRGRLRGVAASLAGAFASVGRESDLAGLDLAREASLAARSPSALLTWLDHYAPPADRAAIPGADQTGTEPLAARHEPPAAPAPSGSAEPDDAIKFGRRAEDQITNPRTLKVDQVKIDRLMNLIGEMVVAKNALPYLAGRAEEVFGVRELAREIKAQYGVINRIAEEMQDAIMQVRMMPVSFVFQRFPRLVRDIAHKLGKEVRLVMEGESTEADKNIIEALADPLIHIVRNSLDHGLETPQERQSAGKPGEGRLTISARQESDRVLIEIADDGRGIDPAVIRRKAYEKGLIDETALERLSDQEAVNLVFAPGFSTAEQITDLSGRGVGMDVVRDAIARVNGAIDLRSQVGQGTRLRLSLPLSMAVTNVMIIESANQRFGVPMDAVAETVRVPRRDTRTIKRRLTTVLRGRLVPLVALNDLLALDAPQIPNDDDELAVLVVRIDQEYLGIIVDDCRETVDIILKPLAGFLGGLAGYAGSALLGDGSVLLVINPRELL